MVVATYIIGSIMTAAAGAGLVFQNGINFTLGNAGGRSFASLISFCTGLAVMVAYFLIDVFAVGTARPKLADLQDAPWWAWIGGPLGAFYVCSAIVFAEKLGSGTLTAISVTAQLICAVFVDSVGLVGFQKRKLQWQRLVGVVLLLVGMALVVRYRGDAIQDTPLPVKSPSPSPTAKDAVDLSKSSPALQ